MNSSTEQQAEIDRKVAQELKNNHDFIYTTNQWLQRLSIALEGLKKEFIEHKDKTGNGLKLQDIEIEKIEQKNSAHRKSCDQIFSEYKHKIQQGIDAYENAAKSSLAAYASLAACNKSTASLQEGFWSLEKESDRIEQLIFSEVIRLTNLIENKTKNLKQEILDMPDESVSLKEAIEEKMCIFNVNFEGVLRELDVIKKNAFISKKYIEDLYNKLDRLKEQQ